MDLTTQQRATLKAFILADPILSQFPATLDGSYAIAELLNKPASPAYIVWRTDVTAGEIGNAWVGTDIDGMSSLNMQRLQLLLASSSGIFNMARIDRRAGFENPFGTNVNNASRVAMRAAWKRAATVLEKLFASGAGTDASPSTMVLEGAISYQEVDAVRAS